MMRIKHCVIRWECWNMIPQCFRMLGIVFSYFSDFSLICYKVFFMPICI